MWPTRAIIERIVFLRFGDISGTGFTIDVDSRQYIVTAEHVVPGIGSGGTVLLFRSGHWSPLKVRNIPCVKDIDVTVLEPETAVTPSHPLTLGEAASYFYGQQMYFLGYPFGEAMIEAVMESGTPIPLARSAHVAGFFKHRAGRQRLLLDGQANVGFSGGPVIFLTGSGEQTKTHVAGVVRESRMEWQPVEREVTKSGYVVREKTDLVARYNSGIVVCDDILYATDAIAADRPAR